MWASVIGIAERLQDAPRILLFPLDEGIAFLLPAGLGLMTQHLLPGLLAAVFSYMIWKRVKGEGGLNTMLAAAYWFTPRIFSPCKSFPDSAVTKWTG